MATGQADEDVFQAGLAGGQVQQLLAILLDRIEQRWNGQVRLANVETDHAVVVANRFNSGKSTPCLRRGSIRIAAHLELHHMVTAEAIDQIRRCAFGDYLPMIDDRQPIAQALGFVHVVGR